MSMRSAASCTQPRQDRSLPRGARTTRAPLTAQPRDRRRQYGFRSPPARSRRPSGDRPRAAAPSCAPRRAAGRRPVRDAAASETPVPAPRPGARSPRTRAALAKMRSAFHAAVIPIGTTSSWLPSVGTDWTLAGVASTRESATSAAEAICAVMKPESRPGSLARKAGSPEERSGFTTRSSRRSASPARVASTIPSTSNASAIGCP